MELGIFVFCCSLFSSIAGFTLPDELTQLISSENHPEFFQNYEYGTNYCVEVCGRNRGVKCVGDHRHKEDITCACEDKSKIFDVRYKECRDCQCKNGRCVKDNRGKIKCNCKRGYALQDENTCAPCDCGKLGKCMFIPVSKSAESSFYIKKCLCDVGSAEKNGVCVDCQCGENSKCEFEDGEKNCYCIDGYAEKDGVCAKCDCGRNGECTFKNGRKRCMCDEDFEEIDGYCVDKCDSVNCQNDGTCQIENGAPICECQERFTGQYCEKDKCDFIKCQNGGICEIDRGSPFCRCPERYTGQNCETDKCSLIRCYNGGACVIQNGEAVCNCPRGYSGQACEIDECSTTTCYNEGKCYMDRGRAVCQCLERFEGEYCEKDRCSDLACQNGGHCEIQGGKPVCKCFISYEGEFCERHKCESVQCLNGGYCTVNFGRVLCVCKDRYNGSRCEIDQCQYLHCQNGGTCVGKNGKAVCECTPKYTGDNCETATCSFQYPCQNGGLCENGICNCLERTSGGFCDVIDECPNLCPRRSDVNCTYDVQRQRAYCECLDRRLGFYPDTQECKRTCDDVGCENGGECKEAYYSKFCDCLDGTSGELCETVDECANMDCGKEATCQYDSYIKSAFCQCHDPKLVLDPNDRTCKNGCQSDSDCFNGGTCIKSGRLGYCNCLEGTKGDLCEEVPGCLHKECGLNAKCEYDVDRRIAMCKCVDKDFAFDPVDYKCKKQCHTSSDCKNGGTCTGGEEKFCRCLNGTTGDFCEEVPVCDNVYCGNQAKCVFDKDRRSAACMCIDNDLAYDEITKVCKKVCHTSLECKNGGDCTGVDRRSNDRFCECLDGTTGDFCEEVPVCDTIHCGNDAKCVFDQNRRNATCMCLDNTLAYDEIREVCRKVCDTSSDCKNGGTCTGNEYSKFCRCLDGTTGDFCEEVPVCDTIHCGNDAKCEFDQNTGSGACKCFDNTLAYDEVSKVCKRPCIQDIFCRNSGLCLPRGRNSFCHCLDGTYGDYCENVEICDKQCGNGSDIFCIYDLVQRKAECRCKDRKYEFDAITKSCKRCDCGGKEISCDVIDGQKRCVCPEGYGVKNGKCQKQRCTDNKCLNGRCEVINDQEICTCFEGYYLDGNECRRKICTKTRCDNGTCIVRNSGQEECICPAGYTLRFGSCIRGKCRIDTCFGGQCKIIQGELTCVCPERYGLEGIGCFETVCKIQRCFGGKCVVENDVEICTCPKGYKLENDVCKMILCEKKNCFGGQCHVKNGEEQCECPAGHSIIEDVCVRNGIRPS